jgi:hypothetical protein
VVCGDEVAHPRSRPRKGALGFSTSWGNSGARFTWGHGQGLGNGAGRNLSVSGARSGGAPNPEALAALAGSRAAQPAGRARLLWVRDLHPPAPPTSSQSDTARAVKLTAMPAGAIRGGTQKSTRLVRRDPHSAESAVGRQDLGSTVVHSLPPSGVLDVAHHQDSGSARSPTLPPSAEVRIKTANLHLFLSRAARATSTPHLIRTTGVEGSNSRPQGRARSIF